MATGSGRATCFFAGCHPVSLRISSSVNLACAEFTPKLGQSDPDRDLARRPDALKLAERLDELPQPAEITFADLFEVEIEACLLGFGLPPRQGIPYLFLFLWWHPFFKQDLKLTIGELIPGGIWLGFAVYLNSTFFQMRLFASKELGLPVSEDLDVSLLGAGLDLGAVKPSLFPVLDQPGGDRWDAEVVLIVWEVAGAA